MLMAWLYPHLLAQVSKSPCLSHHCNSEGILSAMEKLEALSYNTVDQVSASRVHGSAPFEGLASRLLSVPVSANL